MYWKKGQTREERTCMLCGEPIRKGYFYIRPNHKKGVDWNKKQVRGRNYSFNDKTTNFHIDCFGILGGWFESNLPAFDNIYDNTGNTQLLLQEPEKHLLDGKPV